MSLEDLLAEVLHEAVGAELERLGDPALPPADAAGSVKSICAPSALKFEPKTYGEPSAWVAT